MCSVRENVDNCHLEDNFFLREKGPGAREAASIDSRKTGRKKEEMGERDGKATIRTESSGRRARESHQTSVEYSSGSC